MKKIAWKLQFLNPIDQTIIKSSNFNSLKDIGNQYTFIPFNTWRNIAIGRSKVYNRFIKLEKALVEEKQFNGENNI